MAFKVIVTSPAQHDIFRALDWYESRQPGLGTHFYQEYTDIISYLKTNPELFSIKSGNFREAKIASFPYVIIYEININNVFIYAIFNTHLNPTKRPKK
ncbi:MAG: type II toxin-antitoxin system RelE/ParE family toxin [Bacteroidia bacterium]